jgi:signal transduction histidine kinase
MVREDVWQVFDVLDRSQHRPGEIRPTETIVAGADGFVIASSDPVRIPSQVRVPASFTQPIAQTGKVAIEEDAQRAYVRRDVLYENQPIGSIHAALDIAPLIAERRHVLWTLILTNMALTMVLAGAAWFIVGRMMRPVRTLTGYLERSHDGQVDPIPGHVVASASRDYQRPFEAFNRLATAVAEREALGVKLAEEERLASLGRLASGMAHEINNPLGGLFNAIDTLKRHGADVNTRSTTLDLVERGLKGIRDVVRAALMSYRSERDERQLSRDDIEDLKLLISPEASRRDVLLQWRNELAGEVALPASTVRQVILNLALNACQATPRGAWATVSLAESADALVLQVEDAGSGIPPTGVAMLTGTADRPAPIGRGTGLGLWMTNRLVRELDGNVSVGKGAGGGTLVTISFPTRQKVELGHVA